MDRLLIVDDDVELCDLIEEFLRPEGFDIEAVHDGQRGLDRALSGEHVLVVLDVMLPVMNGLDVLRRIRAHSQIPVIILTARGDDVDRIVGLEIGADDYLPKPFNPRELLARIRAILRRSQQAVSTEGEADQKIAIGEVTLDPAARTVRRGGEIVELTSVEFSLLEILMRTVGHVVTREQIATDVLGRRFMPYDRSIDMHVSKVRRKLGPQPDGEERIKTIRGVGYIYARPHEDSADKS